MNWLNEKPYISFLVLIPIIITIGFINRKETLDINVHDTYFVINNLHLAILLVFLFGLIALGYFLAKFFDIPLVNWMTISHVFISLIGITLVYVLFKVQGNLELKTTNIEFFLKYSKTIERISLVLISILMIIIFTQIIFLMNLIIGFTKKRI